MSLPCIRLRTVLRSGLLSSLVLWLILAAGVNIATAHSELADSNPANGAVLDETPDQVWLSFTQELETDGSSLAVFDRNEQQVDDGRGRVDLNDLDHRRMVVDLPASLANGTYIVRWTAVSAADGDTSKGAILFTIGGAVPAAEQPIAVGNNSSLPLLVVAGLIAIGAIVAGAVYVGRKRAIRQQEKVVS